MIQSVGDTCCLLEGLLQGSELSSTPAMLKSQLLTDIGDVMYSLDIKAFQSAARVLTVFLSKG